MFACHARLVCVFQYSRKLGICVMYSGLISYYPVSQHSPAPGIKLARYVEQTPRRGSTSSFDLYLTTATSSWMRSLFTCKSFSPQQHNAHLWVCVNVRRARVHRRCSLNVWTWMKTDVSVLLTVKHTILDWPQLQDIQNNCFAAVFSERRI